MYVMWVNGDACCHGSAEWETYETYDDLALDYVMIGEYDDYHSSRFVGIEEKGRFFTEDELDKLEIHGEALKKIEEAKWAEPRPFRPHWRLTVIDPTGKPHITNYYQTEGRPDPYSDALKDSLVFPLDRQDLTYVDKPES